MDRVVDWASIEHRVVEAVLSAYRTKNLRPQRGQWNFHVSSYRLDDRGTIVSPLRGCCPQTAILVGAYPTFGPDEKLDPEFHIYDHATARVLEISVGYACGLRVGFDLYPKLAVAGCSIEGSREGYQTGFRLARVFFGAT
jgi:hypothetical protein